MLTTKFIRLSWAKDLGLDTSDYDDHGYPPSVRQSADAAEARGEIYYIALMREQAMWEMDCEIMGTLQRQADAGLGCNAPVAIPDGLPFE